MLLRTLRCYLACLLLVGSSALVVAPARRPALSRVGAKKGFGTKPKRKKPSPVVTTTTRPAPTAAQAAQLLALEDEAARMPDLGR